MDCDRINQNLIVGSCLLEAKEAEQLRALGVTAILSLQSEEEMGERGIAWEKQAATAAKLAFRSIPVRNFDSEDLERKLAKCVAGLEGLIKDGHTVYLHCRAGKGRSASVAVAYLHWCLGWELQRALAHVRESRDSVPDADAIVRARWPHSPRRMV
jgi:protein-tyrosine phosphatase